jgi:lipopolysaccharide export system permease protein
VLRIDRYIMQQFLIGIFPALLLLLALFSFMTLAEELENVGQGTYTLTDALWVVFLTTPKRIVELLPVTALLGGLFGLGAMANNRELIAMRTIGVSKQRIAQTVATLALFLGVLITLLQFFMVPGFEREAAQLRGQASQNMANRSGESAALWTRNDQQFVRVNAVQSDRTLTGIEIYTTDEQGRLSRLIQAAKAIYSEQENWLLMDVLESSYAAGQVLETRHTSLKWKALLSAEQASILILPLEALAPNDLVNTIKTLKHNKLDTHHYEVVLWQQVSLLPSLLAMALLSLPFLLGSVREISASQRSMIGGLIGISFYLLQQLSGHLAGLLGLNPSLVILSPPFILLVIAIAAIRHRNL